MEIIKAIPPLVGEVHFKVESHFKVRKKNFYIHIFYATHFSSILVITIVPFKLLSDQNVENM